MHTPENVQRIEMSSKTPAAFSQQLLKEDTDDPRRLSVFTSTCCDQELKKGTTNTQNLRVQKDLHYFFVPHCMF